MKNGDNSTTLRAIKGSAEARCLAILLFLVFSGALAYAFYFHIPPQVDARAYDAIGWNLASGHGYRGGLTGPLDQDQSIGRLGPGYEFFLAALFWLFGHSYPAVWIAQALLHTASAGLVYLLARRLIPGERGMVFRFLSTAVFGFHLDLLQMAAMLMTETLYIFLMMVAVYCAVSYLSRPRMATALLTAILLALAILTRASAVVLLAVFALALLWRKSWKTLLIVLFLQIILIGPWTWRNYRVYHSFILTTAAGGYDLWVGNNPASNGELQPTPEITSYLQDHGYVATNQKGIEEVEQFIVSQPLTFLRLQIVKTVKYFSLIRTSAWWSNLNGLSREITLVLSSGFTFVLMLFGILGAWLAWREKIDQARWLVLFAAATPISVISIVVETRYRYPLYPFLGVFAALALGRIVRKETSLKGLLWVGGALIANSLVDVAGSLPLIIERLHVLFG
ncbi:MAG: glycosyltransferase family 39 protein [Anaerolineales bacterium]